MREVYIVGSGCVPVGKYEYDMGIPIARDACAAALLECGITFREIDAYYAGIASGSTPRAVVTAKQLGLTGVPVVQLTNASASGLTAADQAYKAIAAGEYDVVLVTGYDVPEQSVASSLLRQGFLPPVALFAMWAQRRMHDFDTRPEHFAAIAAKNWNYARSIPHASRRAAEAVTADDILASRMIAEPLTAKMCTQFVSGAAAVVLSSREGLKRFGGLRYPLAKIRASAFQSEIYQDHHIFEGAIVGPENLSRTTVNEVFETAGVERSDVDIVQIHDGFAIEELMYYELFGFSEPGKTEDLVECGAFGPGSRESFGLPEFSTDGGLIGHGHPGGPTGIFQLMETLRRFREHGDHIALCHLLGAGSTCVSMILESARQDGMAA